MTTIRAIALLLPLTIALSGILWAGKDFGEKEKGGYKVSLRAADDSIVAGKETTLHLTAEGSIEAISVVKIVVNKMVDGYRCPNSCDDGESQKEGKCAKCGTKLERGKIAKRTDDKFRHDEFHDNGNRPTYDFKGAIESAGEYRLDVKIILKGDDKIVIPFDVGVSAP